MWDSFSEEAFRYSCRLWAPEKNLNGGKDDLPLPLEIRGLLRRVPWQEGFKCLPSVLKIFQDSHDSELLFHRSLGLVEGLHAVERQAVRRASTEEHDLAPGNEFGRHERRARLCSHTEVLPVIHVDGRGHHVPVEVVGAAVALSEDAFLQPHLRNSHVHTPRAACLPTSGDSPGNTSRSRCPGGRPASPAHDPPSSRRRSPSTGGSSCTRTGASRRGGRASGRSSTFNSAPSYKLRVSHIRHICAIAVGPTYSDSHGKFPIVDSDIFDKSRPFSRLSC